MGPFGPTRSLPELWRQAPHPYSQGHLGPVLSQTGRSLPLQEQRSPSMQLEKVLGQ